MDDEGELYYDHHDDPEDQEIENLELYRGVLLPKECAVREEKVAAKRVRRADSNKPSCSVCCD